MDEINREADVPSWIKHIVMEQRDLVIIVVVIVRACNYSGSLVCLRRVVFANWRVEIDSSIKHIDEPLRF
jgi:hypothetical protein